MMFGSREPFEYNECAACGSLSITEVPADLGRHYPATYYSFGAPRQPRHGHLARRLAVMALLNMPGALSARLPATMSAWRAMGRARVKRSTPILDVGSGSGATLRALERSGFTNLNGVDPFLHQSETTNHITLTKRDLNDFHGSYGFILLSHSLEHMPDPRSALHEVARLCAPGGHVLISVPVINRSWRELGPDWSALDPPRHLFIPSVSGLAAIVHSAPDLRVREHWFDTVALEFYASELARRRIPLFDRATGVATDPAGHFDKAQRVAWERRARDYNRRGEAGTALFLIERV